MEELEELKKKVEKLAEEIRDLKTRRITQEMVVPDVIKTRHQGEPNRFFLSGLAVDRPDGAEVTGGVTCYFAQDIDTLYIFNGSSWVSVVLT